MFSKDITHPEPPTLIQRIAQHFPSGYRKDPDRQRGPVIMAKLAYAQWIEGEVKPMFPKGKLVTFASYQPQAGKEPIVTFKVAEVQEISYLAPVDEVHDQPRAVLILPVTIAGNSPIPYAPKALRELTEEEQTLVQLRHPKSEEVREEVRLVAGVGLCRVDADTGEITRIIRDQGPASDL